MNVIILAAGYGERLYPLTQKFPKALLPINKIPILEFILHRISSLKNIENIYLISNDLFISHFQHWFSKSNFKKKLIIANNGKRSPKESLGAIGDLALILNRYEIHSDLLVIAGDNYFEEDLSEMIMMGKKNLKNNSVIGLVSIENFSDLHQYGVVSLNDQGYVKSVIEKSPNPPSHLISTSIYYFTPKTIPLIKQYVREKRNLDAPGHFIDWLSCEEDILCYFFKKRWYDIGSKKVYLSIKNSKKIFLH